MMLAGILICGSLHGQNTRAQKDSIKTARISRLIDTFYFRFDAEMVFPLGGRSRHLTGDNYDLVVSKDTITAYLPYFGRAYSAPMDPTQGGIQFTSKDFTYTTTRGKKGGWDIAFRFKDGGDVQQMGLNITQDGYATLQVTSINRQSITFNGTITKRKKRKG